MAGLYRRGTTYYALYYIGQKKHRRSLETDNLKIARARLSELETELNSGNDTPFPSKTAIPDVLESFVAYMRSRRSASSVNRDLSPLRIMFGPVCESLKVKNPKIVEKIELRSRNKGLKKSGQKVPPIEAGCFEAITTKNLSDWLTAFSELTAPSPKTLNRYREVIQKMFSWAIETEGLRFPGCKNPAAKVARWREGAPVIIYMARAEIDVQLEVLAGDLKLQTMIATYIYAGLRRSEGLWLQHRDVDLKAGLIHVRAKQQEDEDWDPKTARNRSVPISRQLRPYLEAYVAANGSQVADAWFFPSPEGGVWDPDNFSTRTLAAANKQHGLEWNCKIYRHTFGSHLAMRDVSMHKISKMMGNSVAICERYYAALSPQSLADSVDFERTLPKVTAVPMSVKAMTTRPQLRLVVNRGK